MLSYQLETAIEPINCGSF